MSLFTVQMISRYCDYRIIVNYFGHVKHAVKISYFVRNLLKAEIYE